MRPVDPGRAVSARQDRRVRSARVPITARLVADMISVAGSGLGRGVVVDSSGSQVGYVAQRLRSATKTDTPLIDTPQAISVVTEAQIRDQNVPYWQKAFIFCQALAGATDKAMLGVSVVKDFFREGMVGFGID